MDDRTKEQLYDEANAAYNEGNFETAINNLERLVKVDAEYFNDSYYWLGDSYHQIGNIDKARYCFERAIEIDSGNADAYNSLGIIYYDQERYEEAEKYYHETLKVNDKYYVGYYNLSLIERKRGNTEKEEVFLRKCLDIQPDYAQALNSLGNIHYNRKEYQVAHDLYVRAIRSNPAIKYPYYNLGLIEENNLNYEKAMDFYMKAIEIDPSYELAITSLSDIRKKMSEEKQAFGENYGTYESTNNLKGDPDLEIDIEDIKPPSFIAKIGRNLTELAAQGKLTELVGREQELNTLIEILFKRFKNNPLLIGYPGVGKTVIVEGLAQKIVNADVPEVFKNKKIMELNVGNIIAGTKYRGEMEEKMMKIINEARENEDLILFIDEFHTILRAGAVEGGDLDMAQMLKPALANGELTCIGATTIEEYRKSIERDPALARRFYPLRIVEPNTEETVLILNNMREKANQYYQVELTVQNIEDIVELTASHIKNRYFPDKAIDVMEKVASRNSLKGLKEINSQDIKEIISEMSGHQFSEIFIDEMEKLRHLEKELKKKVFGQSHAINALANILRISKRRLDLNPERPDGVFLFTGPTGVGKTFLAKCLAEYLYGDGDKLLRLDMSEFTEKYSVTRLIGSAPGYIGYDETPGLTRMIEDQPTSILLLDEIEKAHPEVIKLFLQVFDEGFITDSRGKKVYFSEVTIIMTSNALIKIRQSMGFGDNTQGNVSEDAIFDELSNTFPREFLNRIDEIIVFNTLSRENIESILMHGVIDKTEKRFKEEGIELDFDRSVIDQVIDSGYSTEMGARNLHRAFDKNVLSPLVRHIYDHHIESGKLKLKYSGGELKIS